MKLPTTSEKLGGGLIHRILTRLLFLSLCVLVIRIREFVDQNLVRYCLPVGKLYRNFGNGIKLDDEYVFARSTASVRLLYLCNAMSSAPVLLSHIHDVVMFRHGFFSK